MKSLRFLPPLALTVLLAACANMPGNRDADVDALIRSAGIDQQLGVLSQPLDPRSMEGPGALIPDQIIKAINSTVAGALNPDQIRSDVKTSLSKNMSNSELRDARSFFESSVGQHVVAVETGNTSGPGVVNPMQEDKLNALDRATGVSQVVGTLAEQSTSSAFDALTEYNCLGVNQMPMGGLMTGFIKKAQISMIRNGVRKSMNTRYAQLSPDEIDSYLSFAQSQAGQQFFNARNQAFAAGASSAGNQIAKTLVQEIAKACKA